MKYLLSLDRSILVMRMDVRLDDASVPFDTAVTKTITLMGINSETIRFRRLFSFYNTQ